MSVDITSLEGWLKTAPLGDIATYFRIQDDLQDPWNVYPMQIDGVFTGFYITDGYEIFDTVNRRYFNLSTGFIKELDDEETHIVNMWGEYMDLQFDLHANVDGSKGYEERPCYEPFTKWKAQMELVHDMTGRYIPIF